MPIVKPARLAVWRGLPACLGHVNLVVLACQFVWHGGGFTRLFFWRAWTPFFLSEL